MVPSKPFFSPFPVVDLVPPRFTIEFDFSRVAFVVALVGRVLVLDFEGATS